MTLRPLFCSVLTLSWLASIPLRAESRLIFPRLVFQQGRFSGVAIANPTPSEAAIRLTAYNSDGTLFTSDGVTNPRTQTIAAGSQYVKLAWQIFTPPASIVGSAAARFLWMEVTSPTDGLTGFFLEGDDRSEFLDGSDLSGSGADLILPFVQNRDGLTTEISIVNPDASGGADVTVELLGADGAIVRSQTASLAAHAALQGPIASLFPGSYDNVASVRVHSNRPLACLALLTRASENSVVAVISRKGNSPLRTLYFPQLAQGGDWSTYLGLVNLTSARILVTVTAYKKDGALFSAPTVRENPVTCSLAAGGSLRTDVKTLFGFADGPLQEGWIKAEAEAPAITGYVEYGAGTNRALVSAQGEAVTRAIFSYQVNGSGYYTGIALLNSSTIAGNVEIVSMGADGKVLGKTQRALRPGQREAVLIPQWIPGAAAATDGSVFLKSDVPIIATQLFGTSSFTALSNVPPQVVPTAFDPGSGIASLKVTPPLAVVETGKTLKFNSSGPAVSSWKVNDIVGGNSTTGTVSAVGLFAAPAVAPSQHTQTVSAVTSAGDLTGAASVDVVQREVLTSALTLLTAVAYFENLQRFFVAEQQLLSSAPAGGRANASSANTRISEVSTSGTAQSFVQVSNDTIVKMVPFTDTGGGSHLLLAGVDTGTVYRLTLSNKQIVSVAAGLNQPNSLALDPVSGDLLVSEGGANQVTVIPRSAFDPTVSSAPSIGASAGPVAQAIAVSPSPRGVAFDPCTGALYVTTADGVLHEFLENRERQVVAGLNNPGQVLVLLRQGFPSCFEAVTVFVAEPARVAQIDPRAGEVVAFIDAVQDIKDLGFFPNDSPFVPNREESVIVAEGPVGVGLSRVLIVRVGRLYQRIPTDSSLQGGLEFSPAGESIAYRDRRGDTFATIKSRQAGLSIPDIVGISIYRIGGTSTVTVEFAGPVAPWSRGLPNSVMGWIDFDTQNGGGLPSHADPYRPLRLGLPETDAYVDLSTGLLYVATAAPSVGSAAGTVTRTGEHAATSTIQAGLSFLDNTLSVIVPTTYFDALKARISVTVGNSAEVTDIAPEARYAFINPLAPSFPRVQFANVSSSGSESLRAAVIDVTISAVSKSTITVQYAVTGGSATGGGVDYTLPSGTLTFAPGDTSRSIPVTIIDDSLVEGNETIVVQLSNPVNATLGSLSSHTYTISDNDSTAPNVQFAAASSSGSESVTSVNLNVVLSSAATQAVTVQYAATGGTATGAGTDYTLASGSLSFAPGETSKNITMSVVNDTIDEPDETVIVTLSNPANATVGTNAAHTYTILDDDNPTPNVQFASGSSRGSESVTPVNLNVILSGAATQAVTVQYAVTGGTATGGGVDYTLTSGTLSFAPGETSKSITMSVVNDTTDEPDETVIVTLSNPTNATVGTNAAHTYTILDDDNPTPNVQFASGSSSGSESVTPVSLNVVLSNSSVQTVTVQYAVTGGTATPVSPNGAGDYTLTSGTLSFAPGEISKSIILSVINDPINEPDETVIVTLSSASNANLGAIAAHSYTIINDDPVPSAQFNATSSSGSESIASASLTVTLSNPSSSTVTVSFTVGGTATLSAPPKGDFTITASPITFSAGQTQQNISINVYDDSSSEDNETIVVTLSGTSANAKLGPNATYVYTISDNDKPDLVILTPPSLRTVTVPLGGTLSFTSATIQNSGNAPAASFSVGYYFSTDATITSADPLLGSVSAPQGLGAGQSFSTGAQTWPLPTGFAPGTYYVGVLADNANVVQESNEDNNSTSERISVVAPDLVPTDLNISPNPAKVRSTLTISSSIKNQGTAATGAFSIAYYLQTSSRFDPTGKPIFTTDVSTLAAGATLSFPTRSITAGTAGTYYLFMVVDYLDSVNESAEGNNISSVQLNVI